MRKPDTDSTLSLPASDPRNTPDWRNKKINPRLQCRLCLIQSRCPSKRRQLIISEGFNNGNLIELVILSWDFLLKIGFIIVLFTAYDNHKPL